jgi:hypothetical protein
MSTTSVQTDQDQRASGPTAKDLSVQVQGTVQEKTGVLKGQATERMRSVLDERSTQAGEEVASFVQALQKASEQLAADGKEREARAADKAAQQADRLAGYLQRSNGDCLLGDAEAFARGRPWLVGALGAAAGFLASRFLKASSENRYATARQQQPPVAPLHDSTMPLAAPSAPTPPPTSGPEGI